MRIRALGKITSQPRSYGMFGFRVEGLLAKCLFGSFGLPRRCRSYRSRAMRAQIMNIHKSMPGRIHGPLIFRTSQLRKCKTLSQNQNPLSLPHGDLLSASATKKKALNPKPKSTRGGARMERSTTARPEKRAKTWFQPWQ